MEVLTLDLLAELSIFGMMQPCHTLGPASCHTWLVGTCVPSPCFIRNEVSSAMPSVALAVSVDSACASRDVYRPYFHVAKLSLALVTEKY